MGKGIYCLVMELKGDKCIKIGKLSTFLFLKGFYVYVGSAQNGLEKRIARHLRKEKKLRWHIDYFLMEANIIEIWTKENSTEECETAKKLLKHGKVIASKFGASDCSCSTHLVYFSSPPRVLTGFVRKEVVSH